jgi:hypothetical protein
MVQNTCFLKHGKLDTKDTNTKTEMEIKTVQNHVFPKKIQARYWRQENENWSEIKWLKINVFTENISSWIIKTWKRKLTLASVRPAYIT